MPSGRTHFKIEAALMVAWAAGGLLLVIHGRILPVHSLLFLAGYAFSMLFLSPDLDLADSRANRRWGVLRWIWYPYALVFRHRRLSHHLLLGPLSRVGYLAAVGLAMALVAFALVDASGARFRLSARILVPVCLGLYLPNVEHILADRICSRWKRRAPRL